MSKLEFKPEDFKDVMVYHSGGMCGNIEPVQCRELANLTNAMLPELKKAWLEELVKGAPKVYSGRIYDERKGWTETDTWKTDWHDPEGATHTARLICIEEIGK